MSEPGSSLRRAVGAIVIALVIAAAVGAATYGILAAILAEAPRLEREHVNAAARHIQVTYGQMRTQFAKDCEPAIQAARAAWVGRHARESREYEQTLRRYVKDVLFELAVLRGGGSPDMEYANETIQAFAEDLVSLPHFGGAAFTGFEQALMRLGEGDEAVDEKLPLDLLDIAGLDPPPSIREVSPVDEGGVRELAAWIRRHWPQEICYRRTVPTVAHWHSDFPIEMYSEPIAGRYSGSVAAVLPRQALLGRTTLRIRGGTHCAVFRSADQPRADRIRELRVGDEVQVEVRLKCDWALRTRPWIEVVNGRLEVYGLTADVELIEP